MKALNFLRSSLFVLAMTPLAQLSDDLTILELESAGFEVLEISYDL